MEKYMDDMIFFQSVIKELDIVVLKRIDQKYITVGNIPDFYNRLYPCNADGSACSAPWNHSDMLSFFLDDAELFFERGLDGHHASGIWQEDGCDDETALVAYAIINQGQKAIVIRKLSDEYVERVRILQKARTNLLERRDLNTSLEIYKRISRHDSLTGIYNRQTFMEILESEIKNSKQTGASLALMILDIDKFKDVNDTYGHLAGDAVLANLGQILKNHLRGGDIVARYGGEEFCVLTQNITKENMFSMAENVRKRIEAFTFPEPKHITISVGYTMFLQNESVNDFIQRADFALYDAKRSGRNTVRIR